MVEAHFVYSPPSSSTADSEVNRGGLMYRKDDEGSLST